ncbi:DUF6461 domain-containing protein [Nucisporomicrobium flavum]|uniref:DUF6461 domain-containing protein n=1 Tax=Nucisporomicrobium flavum TaxID=2785915 RepID=UPI0018F488EB|nr:DUF6461 domain-containing protein [Nucisporomicrobium flavum]
MAGVPDTPIDDLTRLVATAMPALERRIAASPARLLGRLGAPEAVDRHAAGNHWPQLPADDEPACLTALRMLGPLPVERLLGALELTVAELAGAAVPDLLADLPQPPDGRYAWIASGGHDSEATSAARLLEGLRPGLADHTVHLVRRVAAHPALAESLLVAPDAVDEPAIAAAHGAAHLALAVAVAVAVVDQADPPVMVERAAATVGLGVGAAALLLRETAMPDAYAAALLAKIRADYLLPRHSSTSVEVTRHRFALVEHAFPGDADFSANGLVAVADGGLVIHTGVGRGRVNVELEVLEQAPDELEPGWEEAVEVSWHAAEGHAGLAGPDGPEGRGLDRQTPPWPGDYRVRVHARGRDDNDAEYERHKLVVWAAPAAPEIVYRRTDRLGHRLRGEPEPVRPPRPEHAYRWVRRSPLAMAATITVVTGATVDQVLQAFGADPHRPEPIDAIQRDLSLRSSTDSWVSVLAAGDAVLVVEENTWRGTDPEVLVAASAGGRAGSMFWNVNALTQLSLAEHGRVLASFEPWGGEQVPAEVAAALDGVDFAEPGDRIEKGLVAVERFTGTGISAADLGRIRDAGIGYRVPA